MIENITDTSGINFGVQGGGSVEDTDISFKAIFETTLESAEPENWDPENTGQFITMGEVNKAIKQDFSNFQKLVDGVLEDAGISLYPEFSVRMDTENNLYIDGERRDKALIENLLNSNSEICKTFSSLQENVLLEAKMEKLMDFIKVYSGNELSIAETRQQLLSDYSGEDEDFAITVTDDSGYKPSLSVGGKEFELSVFSEIEEAIAAGIDYTVDYPQELEFTYSL